MNARNSGFEGALQQAVTRASNEDTPDLPPEHKAELLRELVDFYRAYKSTIDLAVDGILTLSASPDGAPQAERLERALRRETPDVDGEAARSLLRGAELQPFTRSAEAQGVAAVSVGVSLGLGILIGAAAGADALINVDDNQVYVRGFAVVDLGLDAFAGIGLNVGIWPTMPTVDKKTYIGGLLLDVPLGVAVIRLMVVRQGPGMTASVSDFETLGITIAINYGLGGGVALYRGPQYVLGKGPRRAALTVCNCTDGTDPCKPGTSSIAQNAVSKLCLTVENTSEKTITIAPGNELIVRLPTFFTSSDVAAIQVTPPDGWTVEEPSGNGLSMTYAGSAPLAWTTGSLRIVLANARPSQPDPLTGQVWAAIPDAVVENSTIDKDGFFAGASLALVPAIQYATLSWSAIYPDFTLVSGEPASGASITVSSQPDAKTVIQLTEVTDASGVIWVLGCQFYIDDSSQQPYFRACWWKQGTPAKDGKTLYAPNFMILTSSPQMSTAYYENIQGSQNLLQINVALNPQ